MPTNIRISLNPAGIRALLNDPGVAANLEHRAQKIATAAGPGFVATPARNRTRAVAFVTTATPEARRAEAENRALTRALNAGRR